MGKMIMKALAWILKRVGITKLTDWLITGGWKLIEAKVVNAILRKLSEDSMPKLKVKAHKFGVKFSKSGRKLADRGHLSVDTWETGEDLLFILIDDFQNGASSDDA